MKRSLTFAERMARRFRTYKGVRIHNVGLSYFVWLDFVTQLPRHCMTLAEAKSIINAAQLSH